MLDDTSYVEIRKIVDPFYSCIQRPTAEPIYELLSKYQFKLRQDDGQPVQINISKPAISLDTHIIVGIRYVKFDGTYTEDHFVFQVNFPIKAYHKRDLEREFPEYIGTHKQQPDISIPVYTANTISWPSALDRSTFHR